MAQYKRTKMIGRGGFGAVWACRRTDTGEEFAMKRLRPDADAAARQRFIREVKIQGALDHPNIVPIVGRHMSDDPLWFVMPLALSSLFREGGELDDEIDSECGASESVLSHGPQHVWVVRDACRGLAHLHEQGYIHRDIKPANILLFETDDGPYAALSDYGLGRSVDPAETAITATGELLGTFAYMAPEQWAGADNAKRSSDTYSMGLVLYEVLTGEHAYLGLDLDLVPVPYQSVVKKATARRPENRYDSATAMLEALETAMDDAEAEGEV
jgi:serine/threonine-protein kinase